MVEPTEDERKNGWTAETLRTYIEGREKVQAGVVLFNPDYRKTPRPKWANNRYNPLKWH